jgi:hypothetical protein
MPGSDDDLFGADGDEAGDEFARLSELLLGRVSEFADEEDVPDELLPPLLMQLSVTLQMLAYVASVAQPSGSGLKRDLDRFQRDTDDLIRGMKKEADRIVAEAKKNMTAAGEGEDET